MVVKPDIVNFMFPCMLVIVFTMLGLMRMGHQLQRWKGVVLMVLCIAYLSALVIVNPGALEASHIE